MLNSILFYIIFISVVCVHYGLYAYLSLKNNNAVNNTYAIYMFLLGCFGQYWIIVSRLSKNIIFDSIIYDLAIIISYFSVLIFFNQSTFSLFQKIGLAFVLLGLCLMHLRN